MSSSDPKDDKKMIMKIEDLINNAINVDQQSTVNFRLIQTVLHILARQLRVLEMRVELRDESPEHSPPPTKRIRDASSGPSVKDKAGKGKKGSPERPKGKDSLDETTKKSKQEVTDKPAKAEKSGKSKAEKDMSSKTAKDTGKDMDASDIKSLKDTGKKSKSSKDTGKDMDASDIKSLKDTGKKSKSSKDQKEDEEPSSARKEDKDKSKKKKVESEPEKPMKSDAESETDKLKKKKGKKDKEVIQVTEKASGKDTVLVVDRGGSSRDIRSKTSIDVVTQSQFELLENLVGELMKKAGPLPMPTLPDNEALRKDLARGSADLASTMNAMQINARVQAAEEAIRNFSELLTQLAASGALPPDVNLEHIQMGLDLKPDSSIKARQSVMAKKSVIYEDISEGKTVTAGALSRKQSLASGKMASRAPAGVTVNELQEILNSVTEVLKKQVNANIAKASTVADTSAAAVKSVTEKAEMASRLDNRLRTLHTLVTDYAEQLSGFDSGLTVQMQGFQEQMTQMRGDLKAGLGLLENVNNNAETAAVMELTERFQGLVQDLDHTLNTHADLSALQRQLDEQMKTLINVVEMMREEKADRDEILDALRDKADSSRLQGLLNDKDFAIVTAELEQRLAVCHLKFQDQEKVWMQALKDLNDIVRQKADIYQMASIRENFSEILNDMHDKLVALAKIVGEPKAAMLTRKLSRGAKCAACMVGALMEAQDIAFGMPPLLPAVRTLGAPAPPPTQRDDCLADLYDQNQVQEIPHVCHRWVGGSHTLLSRHVTKGEPGPDAMPPAPEGRKYTGFGNDGRLYMFEEPCLPCVECNKGNEEENLAPPPTADNKGGGDQGNRPSVTIVKVD